MSGAERVPLVQRRLLDVRPAAAAAVRPIADAVNIPLDELPDRTHELPERDEIILVAGPADRTAVAIGLLQQLGRSAAAAEAWSFAPAALPLSSGRLWRPNRFLEEVAAALPPARALDLACGVGREAVWLAARGWQVTGVDLLPDALERARSLERVHAAAAARVSWAQADLELQPPAWQPRTPSELICLFRFLHRPLFATIREWLAPGGSLLCETFTVLHRARHGKPQRSQFVLEPGELRGLLGGWELRHYSEDWRGTAHTARAWAVRR